MAQDWKTLKAQLQGEILEKSLPTTRKELVVEAGTIATSAVVGLLTGYTGTLISLSVLGSALYNQYRNRTLELPVPEVVPEVVS